MLIRKDKFPPGGFRYKQPETGREFDGMVGFDITAAAIFQHRRGNNLKGDTVEQVIADLEAYTCQRLGFDPRYCTDGTPAAPKAVVTKQKAGCSTCGGKRKKA